MALPEGKIQEIIKKIQNYKSELQITTQTQQEIWWDRYTTDQLPIDIRQSPDYITTDTTAPDNRLVNSYDSEIVDNRANYLLVNPMSIEYDDAKEDEEQALSDFRKLTSYDNFMLKAAKYAGASGSIGVLLFLKDTGEAKPEVRMEHILPFEYYLNQNSDKTETFDGMRFWTVKEVNNEGNIETIYKYEFYDKENVYYFRSDSGTNAYALDLTRPNAPEGFQPHFMGDVPLVTIRNNDQIKPSFYKVISLIDAYNNLISDFDNEMENFRHAYMILRNYKIDAESEAQLKQLRQMRALMVDADGDAKFLTKDIKVDAFQLITDILKKNIERFSGNLDYSDPNVFGKATNLSITTRLKPLENHAKAFGLELKEALDWIFRLVFNYWNKTSGKYDWKKLQYQFIYDKPINDVEEVQKLTMLKTLGMSQIDIYSLASFIDDPKGYLDRYNEEREEMFGDMDIEPGAPVELEEDESQS